MCLRLRVRLRRQQWARGTLMRMDDKVACKCSARRKILG